MPVTDVQALTKMEATLSRHRVRQRLAEMQAPRGAHQRCERPEDDGEEEEEEEEGEEEEEEDDVESLCWGSSDYDDDGDTVTECSGW